MEKFIPLELLQSIMKKYPHSARDADIIRAKKKTEWPAWCFLPEKELESIISPKNLSQRLDLIILSSCLAWRPAQDIIRFDKSLYDALVKTPIADNVPDSIFRKIPAWCIYIELLHDDYHGVFISLDYENTIEKLKLLFIPKKGIMIFPEYIILGYDSIKEGLLAYQEMQEKKMNFEISKSYSVLKNNIQNDEYQKMHNLELQVLSLFLYLCSNEIDWGSHNNNTLSPTYPNPKKVKSGWRLFPPDAPRIWNVGETIGIKIRSASSHTGTHNGPSPHIRRAHWHSFWTGKKVWKEGEEPAPQQLIVKWLPPIAVAMGDEPESE